MTNREKKFTSGPWESGKADCLGGRHYCVCLSDDIEVGIALTGEVGDGDDDISMANANLIAAAPEMLEALETVDRYFTHCYESKNHPQQLMIDNLREAIAKAYGE